jgi:hypothetical protein
MNKHSHKMAYEIYQALPASQRSDFIRLAIILINDRDEQLNRIKGMLSVNDIHIKSEKTKPEIGTATDKVLDISDGMLDFITNLQIQK